ncbi:28448_t:CDS:2, partial [Racocetra persica]
SVAKSVASSSLESYIHQKDANSHNKDKLKLPEKRDIIFENGDKDQYIVQLDDIIGYTDKQ